MPKYPKSHLFRLPISEMSSEAEPSQDAERMGLSDAGAMLQPLMTYRAVKELPDDLHLLNAFGYMVFEEAFLDLLHPFESTQWYCHRNRDHAPFGFDDHRPQGMAPLGGEGGRAPQRRWTAGSEVDSVLRQNCPENVVTEVDDWMVKGKVPKWLEDLKACIGHRWHKPTLSPEDMLPIANPRDPPETDRLVMPSLCGERPSVWRLDSDDVAVYRALQYLVACRPRGEMPPRKITQGVVQGWRLQGHVFLSNQYCWHHCFFRLGDSAPKCPVINAPLPRSCSATQAENVCDLRWKYAQTVDALLAGLCSHPACKEHRSVLEFVKIALDLGASPNACTPSGLSALQLLARRDDELSIEELLGAGAAIDFYDHRGYTALMEAAAFDSPRAALVLLENGASPFLRSRSGKTIEELVPQRARVLGILRSWKSELKVQSESKETDFLRELEREEEAERNKREKRKKKKLKQKEKRRNKMGEADVDNADGTRPNSREGTSAGEDAENPDSTQNATAGDETKGREGKADGKGKEREGKAEDEDKGKEREGSASGSASQAGPSGRVETKSFEQGAISPEGAEARAASDAESSDSEAFAETTVGVLGGRFGALGLNFGMEGEQVDWPGPSGPRSNLPRNEAQVQGKAAKAEKNKGKAAPVKAQPKNPVSSSSGTAPALRFGPASSSYAAPADRTVASTRLMASARPQPDMGSWPAAVQPPPSHTARDGSDRAQSRHAKPASFFRGPSPKSAPADDTQSSGAGRPGSSLAAESASAPKGAPARPADVALPSKVTQPRSEDIRSTPKMLPSRFQEARSSTTRGWAGDGARPENRGSVAESDPSWPAMDGAPGRPHPAPPVQPPTADAPSAQPSTTGAPPAVAGRAPGEAGASLASMPVSASKTLCGDSQAASPRSPPVQPPAELHAAAGFDVPRPTALTERPAHEIIFPFPVVPPPPFVTALPAPQAFAPPPPPGGSSASSLSAPAALPARPPSQGTASLAPIAPVDAPSAASSQGAPPSAPQAHAQQAARDRSMIQTLRALLNAERTRRTRAEAEAAKAKDTVAAFRAALETARGETRAALQAEADTKKAARDALRSERAARETERQELEGRIRFLRKNLEEGMFAAHAEEAKKSMLEGLNAFFQKAYTERLAQDSLSRSSERPGSVAVSSSSTDSGARAETGLAAAAAPSNASAQLPMPGNGGGASRAGAAAAAPDVPAPLGLGVGQRAVEHSASGTFAPSASEAGGASTHASRAFTGDLAGSRVAVAASASRFAQLALGRGVLFDAGGFGVVGGGGQSFDAGGFGIVDPQDPWNGAGAARPPIPSWEALWRDRQPEPESASQRSQLGTDAQLPLNLDSTP